MKTWALVAISLVLLVSLVGVGGCASDGSTTETPPAAPLTVEVSFPDGAPPLNQTAELICTVRTNGNLKNMSLEIILPEGFELASGSLSWSGDILGGGEDQVEVEVIKAVIKSVKVGNWTIELAGYLNPEENAGLGLNGPGPICYVSVREDSAEWGKYPPWYEGGGVEVPLEQLDAPSSGIEVDLSISNAPALGETAELTCTITSHYDAPNVTAEIILDSGLELVAGDLVWEGDLAVDTPIQFKATIKSIKIGDWGIEAKALYLPYEGACYVGVDYLYISVFQDSATVSHRRPESEVPQLERKLDPAEISDFGPSLVDPLDEPPEPGPP